MFEICPAGGEGKGFEKPNAVGTGPNVLLLSSPGAKCIQSVNTTIGANEIDIAIVMPVLPGVATSNPSVSTTAKDTIKVQINTPIADHSIHHALIPRSCNRFDRAAQPSHINKLWITQLAGP